MMAKDEREKLNKLFYDYAIVLIVNERTDSDKKFFSNSSYLWPFPMYVYATYTPNGLLLTTSSCERVFKRKMNV